MIQQSLEEISFPGSGMKIPGGWVCGRYSEANSANISLSVISALSKSGLRSDIGGFSLVTGAQHTFGGRLSDLLFANIYKLGFCCFAVVSLSFVYLLPSAPVNSWLVLVKSAVFLARKAKGTQSPALRTPLSFQLSSLPLE